MRKDWPEKKLDELCNIARGGSPRPIKEYLTDDPDGINWIKISDATASSKYIYETKQKIKSEGVRRSRLVHDGDFLLSNSMSFGRPYIMRTSGCIHDGWLVLADIPETLNQDYLYHFLSSPEAYQQFDDRAAGSTVRNLNIDLVRSVKIPVPPLDIQKRIVAILDEAFARIDTAIANTEKNLANARELFESYLNEVFTQKGEGWVEKNLGDVTTLYQGLAINKKTKHLLVEHSELPLLRIKDLREKSHEQYVAEEGFPSNAKVLPEDIIYTRTGQIGLVFRGRKGVLHNNCFKIVPSGLVMREYLFWFLQVPVFKRKIVALASRAAQPDITHKLFKIQEIIVPPIFYQEQAVKVIEKLYSETQRLDTIYQQKLGSLKELKQSLLQKAFSGELTAEDIKPSVEVR